MKKILTLTALSITALILNGCYTQIATSDSDTETIVIYYPELPEPCCTDPAGPPPTYYPPPQREKTRKPEQTSTTNEGSVREKLRNSGGRSNSEKRKR